MIQSKLRKIKKSSKPLDKPFKVCYNTSTSKQQKEMRYEL